MDGILIVVLIGVGGYLLWQKEMCPAVLNATGQTATTSNFVLWPPCNFMA
jgi:hypothetical protein